MKCIQCGTNSLYKVRLSNGGCCASCKQKFAFEPKTDPLKMSDGLFQKIIKDVSGDGKLFFTEKQIWYEFNRKILKQRTVSCGSRTAVLILGLAFAPQLLRHVSHSLLFLMTALCLMTVVRPRKKPVGDQKPLYLRIGFSQFTDYLKKWTHTYGPLAKLLPPVTGPVSGSHHHTPPDVTAYSFDRVVVTEHAAVAAMLVANNFHFENNCAILSKDGYPYDRFDSILEMLRRNPQLKVFTLHDATPKGNSLSLDLRTNRWFSDPSPRIIDLGLRPLHAQKARMVLYKVEPEKLQPTGHSSLTVEELAWLAAGNRAEVEAVRPEKLMRAIYQGFARANQVGEENDSVYDDTGGVIWIYDGNMDIYASDSFG